jgi:hypothetical protein
MSHQIVPYISVFQPPKLRVHFNETVLSCYRKLIEKSKYKQFEDNRKLNERGILTTKQTFTVTIGFKNIVLGVNLIKLFP